MKHEAGTTEATHPEPPTAHGRVRDRSWSAFCLSSRFCSCLFITFCSLLCLGCVTHRSRVEKNLLADQHTTRRGEGVATTYVIGCPDVIEVDMVDAPAWSGRYRVGADGRIQLPEFGRLRVEGSTIVDIANDLSELAGVHSNRVSVRVKEFNSKYLLVFGQVVGWQQSIPYRGQETVLDVLQRIGGITKGAAPDDVYVVRTHVAEGERPEVFHVELGSIVMSKDESTNIRLLPYDHIFVGETRQARVERIIPPWLRPLFRALSGTQLSPEDRAKRIASARDVRVEKRAKFRSQNRLGQVRSESNKSE